MDELIQNREKREGETFLNWRVMGMPTSGTAMVTAYLKRCGVIFPGINSDPVPLDPEAGWNSPGYWERLSGGKVVMIYRDPWEVVAALRGVPQDPSDDGGWTAWGKMGRRMLDFQAQHSGRCVLISTRGFLQQPRRLIEILNRRAGLSGVIPDRDGMKAIDPRDFIPLSLAPIWRVWQRDWLSSLGPVLQELEARADLPSEPIRDPCRAQVTVVIPCYNDGQYLRDAVFSVQRSVSGLADVIIADDESTDGETLSILDELQKDYRVLRLTHGGLSRARNEAIKVAQTPYILPLDADNLIEPAYLAKAVDLLDWCPEVGMVYANAIYFGRVAAFCGVPEFSVSRFLCANTIDACAVFRKRAWEQVGGYDEGMPDQLGFEDWEFWIRLLRHGWKFNGLDEYLFYYRTREGSMVSRCNQPDNFRRLVTYIVDQHRDFYREHLPEVVAEFLMSIKSGGHFGVVLSPVSPDGSQDAVAP